MYILSRKTDDVSYGLQRLSTSPFSPAQHKFPGVVRAVMFFLAIVFSVFGCMGYLAYGENTEVGLGSARGTSSPPILLGKKKVYSSRVLAPCKTPYAVRSSF